MTVSCVDCGEEFERHPKARKSRCDGCQSLFRRTYHREYQRARQQRKRQRFQRQRCRDAVGILRPFAGIDRRAF